MTRTQRRSAINSDLRNFDTYARKLREDFDELRKQSNALFSSVKALPLLVENSTEQFFAVCFKLFTLALIFLLFQHLLIKAFHSYDKLWQFQREYRTYLDKSPTFPLRRVELGDISSRIGALYFEFFQRTNLTRVFPLSPCLPILFVLLLVFAGEFSVLSNYV
jgi:hypothetical protein